MSGQPTNSKFFMFFVIFIVIQKTFSAFVEIQYPEYKYINTQDSYGLTISKLRTIINLTCSFMIIYVINFYDIHIFLKLIFILLLLNYIMYFLFYIKYIDLCISEKNQNSEFIKYMDKNGYAIGTVILSNVTLFLLIILLA
jgi:hypothetical protein